MMDLLKYIGLLNEVVDEDWEEDQFLDTTFVDNPTNKGCEPFEIGYRNAAGVDKQIRRRRRTVSGFGDNLKGKKSKKWVVHGRNSTVNAAQRDGFASDASMCVFFQVTDGHGVRIGYPGHFAFASAHIRSGDIDAGSYSSRLLMTSLCGAAFLPPLQGCLCSECWQRQASTISNSPLSLRIGKDK
uniref:Uncharacterized protein n=1 Tax=Romanomermis culicivorax TaxID=13658 RepID=A0A915JLD1_ROMCU